MIFEKSWFFYFFVLFIPASCFANKDFFAHISLITPEILKRMHYSWRSESPVALEDLRYIALTHWGFDGHAHDGELIVHALVADEIVEIFQELYDSHFPLTMMKLVDEFKGDDDLSMEANNCYAHCSRCVAHTTIWSNHAYGLAIDINPVLNPFIRGSQMWPASSYSYGYYKRDNPCLGMITKNSKIYEAFISRGWMWGGECFIEEGYYDLHHFQKVIPGLNKIRNVS